MAISAYFERRVSKWKLRHKIVVSYTVAFTILVGITFIAIYFIAEENREEEFFRRLKDKAVSTFAILLKVEQIDHEMLQLFDKNTINSLYEEKTMIFDSTGRLIYSSIEEDKTDYFRHIIEELRSGEQEVKFNEGKYELLALHFLHQDKPYFVVSKAFDRFGKSKLQFLAGLLIISFIIVTLLSIAISLYLSKGITKPVTSLTEQIEKISTANLSVRVKKMQAEDEIAFLAEKFNELLEKLENAFKFQYHFVHHVSHELKTPLTVMMSNAERALNSGEQEALEKSLKFQITALMDVSNVIDAMLDISKTEKKLPATAAEPIRIDELLFECIEELRYFNDGCKFNFNFDSSVESSEGITVNGNSRMLKMALINLMKNAINYSDNETPSIQLASHDNKIQITIINDGFTIDEEEQHHLFNHLFRGRNSSNKKGFGLGLVLAHRIIALHDGIIRYMITPDHKNCFQLQLLASS